jgi:multiple sugar transport system substrate-binding protein
MRAVRLSHLSVAALVCLVLVTTGCGSSDSEGSDSAGGSAKATLGSQGYGPSEPKVTISFVNPEVKGSFDPLIERFEREHPNIEVRSINVPFDQINSTLQARLGSRDKSVDVYVVDPPAIPNLVERNFLADLSALKADAQAASLEAAFESTQYEGKLWALPIWTSEQYLYFNRDLLKQAGVEPPAADPAERWTWEQTVDAAKQAQDAGARWGLLFDQTDRYYQLQALAESAGGGPGLTGDGNLEPDLTNPGWVKAMTWYRSLFEDGLAPRGVATDQMNPTFAAGKAAFFVGGPWALTNFTAAKSLEFGVAPHPYFEGGKPATPTDSWAWGINPASDKQEAAAEFVKFASLESEGNLATIEKIFIPPTNRDAFDVYLERLNKSGGAETRGAGELMLAELEETATHRPATPGYLQFETLMNSKVFPDIRNGADPAQRLERANQELSSAFTRLR